MDSAKARWAARHAGDARRNLAKKWSLRAEPGGDLALMVCTDSESGTSSISAVRLLVTSTS